MGIFMFEICIMRIFFEKGQFHAYAVNFEIPPGALFKLVVLCTEIRFQSVCPLRCIRVCTPGPGLKYTCDARRSEMVADLQGCRVHKYYVAIVTSLFHCINYWFFQKKLKLLSYHNELVY